MNLARYKHLFDHPMECDGFSSPNGDLYIRVNRSDRRPTLHYYGFMRAAKFKRYMDISFSTAYEKADELTQEVVARAWFCEPYR